MRIFCANDLHASGPFEPHYPKTPIDQTEHDA